MLEKLPINLVVLDEENVLEYISYMYFLCGFTTLLALQFTTAPYGRYSRSGWGLAVGLPANISWFVQEFPSFCIPFLVAFHSDCPKSGNLYNRLSLGLFLLHYLQRTFIFPVLIRGGKTTPLIPFLIAVLFCTTNGYLQGSYILKYADLEITPHSSIRVLVGVSMFLLGFTINIHSDHVLRYLRKDGETDYKIPTGGLFEYVSGANFFGELLEWWGFAVLNWSLPSLAFAVWSSCNLVPRACHHHKWYKKKFEDYPKKRKALIPFIL